MNGKRGNRGNRARQDERREFARSVSKDAKSLMPHGSGTERASEASVFWSKSSDGQLEGENGQLIDVRMSETEESHIVPRESYTSKHNLQIFKPHAVEVIDLKARVSEYIDTFHPNGVFKAKVRTGRLIEVSNPKVLKMSDTNLLRQGNPFKDAKDDLRNPIKRLTSRSKRITYPDGDLRTIENQSSQATLRIASDDKDF